MEMISINMAAARGISRVRNPVWANAMDHLKIDIINKRAGPWTHLYSPFNKEINGRDPVDILVLNMDYDDVVFVLYDGPLPDSNEYQEAVAAFGGVLSNHDAEMSA